MPPLPSGAAATAARPSMMTSPARLRGTGNRCGHDKESKELIFEGIEFRIFHHARGTGKRCETHDTEKNNHLRDEQSSP